MTRQQSRCVPNVNGQRASFRQHPTRTNQEWADDWGVSREYVRRLRKALGFAPTSQILRQVRAEQRARAEAVKAIAAAQLSDRVCPVDGAPVPVSRKLTCSSECAGVYRSTFTYRVKR